MKSDDIKEYKNFIKNISIFFIIIEVLAGIGAFTLTLLLVGSKLVAILVGVVVSAWANYILINVLKILKMHNEELLLSKLRKENSKHVMANVSLEDYK